MKLYGSTRSPHVRKVLIAAHETGAIGRITLLPVVVSPAIVNPPMLTVNPLGQVPTLLPEDGSAPLYDSAVICRYLDLVLGDGRLHHPYDVRAELAMQQRYVLGDGLTALLMSLIGETARAQTGHSDKRIAVIREKLPRVFATLESEAPAMREARFDMGQIAIVAALAYLDFRLPAEGIWRNSHPALDGWFGDVSTRPSVVATAYFDDLATPRTSAPQPTGAA